MDAFTRELDRIAPKSAALKWGGYKPPAESKLRKDMAFEAILCFLGFKRP
jgi:hypothetical protein